MGLEGGEVVVNTNVRGCGGRERSICGGNVGGRVECGSGVGGDSRAEGSERVSSSGGEGLRGSYRSKGTVLSPLTPRATVLSHTRLTQTMAKTLFSGRDSQSDRPAPSDSTLFTRLAHKNRRNSAY